MWCSISFLRKLIDYSYQWVIPRNTKKISSNNGMVFYRNSKHSRLNLTHSRSQDVKRKVCLHCGTTSSAVSTWFDQVDNWNLHFSWVRCAIYIYIYIYIFSLSCVSYNRWVALHYEDSLALLERFSDMYGRFINGEFVVSHSLRKDSVVPIEQALEKTFNKPVKPSSNHFFANERSLP